MPQYGLLARAIMIVDNDMNVVYIDYAEEVTHELDLMNALAYLKKLTTTQQ
jgi:peroxiredoxin